MIWSDAQKQEVVSLWQNHSASEIANLFRERGFDVTRNSIIGIAYRAGCSKPKPEKRPRKPRKPNKPRLVHLHIKVAAEPPSINLATVDLPSLNKTIVDLERGDCRYIAGEPASALYCGHPIHNRSFCLAHFHLCYTTAEARKPNPSAFTSGFRARAA